MSDPQVLVQPVIVSCAVRYALGRRSYLPGLIADEVRRVWPHLGGQRDVIREDVEHWLGSRAASDMVTIDVEAWSNLLCWINTEGQVA